MTYKMCYALANQAIKEARQGKNKEKNVIALLALLDGFIERNPEYN